MLSDPRIIFGVHGLTPYERSSGLPFGTIRVLKGSTFTLTGDLVELNAGSAKFSWAIEENVITSELQIKPAEFPNFLIELFLGKKPTLNASEAAGSVTNGANKKGTTVIGATGISAVEVDDSDELKFGDYVIKAVSATTVDLFSLSNVDFERGTPEDYEDDLLKINDTPIAIVLLTDAPVTNFGFKLVGGAGAIAMVVGDTAKFSVRPPNSESTEVIIGGLSDVFPTFGALAVAQKRGTGEMMMLDIFKLKAIGLPFNMEEKAFAEAEITAKASYDAAESGVFKFKHVKPI